MVTPQLQKRVSSRFTAAFGGLPNLWIRAPGRIRLFGDPLTPNIGLGLAFAVDRYIELAASPASGPDALLSVDTGEKAEADGIFDESHWASPMLQVIHAFRKRNPLTPAIHAAFTGTLPSSAGLGAFAALATSLALALDHLAGTHLSAFEMTELCGLADMLPILLAKHECALKLDGSTEEHSCIPLRINPYRFLLSYVPLRLTPDEILAAASRLPSAKDWDAVRLSEENRHVLEAEKCLLAGDLDRFGKLLNHSARSEKRNLPFPSREADTLMELSSMHEGILGGTYLGDGPEAAILSLVHRDAVTGFTDSIRKGFRREYGLDPSVIECHPSDGASVSEGMDGLESHPGWSVGGSRILPAGFGSRH